MKNLWNISSWVIGLVLMVSLLAFSADYQMDKHFSGLEISIQGIEEYHFITQNEVSDLVYNMYPNLDSLQAREINKNLLEESLDNHPSIHKAEVYSTLSGILWINIIQKRPVYRVQNSERAYYIDQAGGQMPLSPHYSADVPLVTGKITQTTEAEIHAFLKESTQDEFFQNFFDGLDIAENGEWTIYPKVSSHRIILGPPENLEDKLRRLKIFYQKAEGSLMLDDFKTLNLSYDGQVVCTKI